MLSQEFYTSTVATGCLIEATLVGAVRELASMKRQKLWKMGEDGLCCSSSAIQTRPGPSSLLEEQSKTPIVFVVFFVLSVNPQNGGNGQGIYNETNDTGLRPVCFHPGSERKKKTQERKWNEIPRHFS